MCLRTCEDRVMEVSSTNVGVVYAMQASLVVRMSASGGGDFAYPEELRQAITRHHAETDELISTSK